MLSLSTAYLVNKAKSWQEITARASALGYNSLELNVEFPEAWLGKALESVESGEISISSLHNYCPRLKNVPENRNIHSAFSFTSQDDEERNTAVKLTKETIDCAKRLGAGAVVVHAGSVPAEPSGKDLYRYAVSFGLNGRLMENYKSSLKRTREEQQDKSFERLVSTLGPVLEHASRVGMPVGLENRIYYDEMPSLQEMVKLMDMFKGSTAGYWHDTGHAEIMARLGFVKDQSAYLEAFKGNIIGCHLHDVRKLRDHYAPGSGELDFEALKGYLKDVKIKVVEAHPQASDKEVQAAVKFLKKTEIV